MKYILDAQEMQTKEDAQDYLKKMFDFPQHYGRNLDALYDCLSDMEETEVEIKNLAPENVYVKQIVKVMKAAGAKVEIA